MALDEMVVIFLPIVLFILTLIIIFVMRENDNRKRGITNVRRLTDQYRNDLDRREENFRTEVGELENRMSKNDTELKGLIQTATAEINSIKAYTEDMANLRHSMDTYREALAALAKLTTDADSKITQVENDVQRLEAVRNMIDTFKLDMKDADEHLKQYENTVIQLQKDTVTQLESSISAFKEQAGKTLEDTKNAVMQYNTALEEKIDATKVAADALHSSSLELIQTLGDRTADQQVLANEIAKLTATRNELSKNLSELNNQVEEKRSFAAQLDDIAREENARLAQIKDNIKTYENVVPPAEPVEILEEAGKTEVEEVSNSEQDYSETDYQDAYRRDNYSQEAKMEEEPEDKPEEEPENKTVVPEGFETDFKDEPEDSGVNEIIIEEDNSQPKVEYYGQEEEIVF